MLDRLFPLAVIALLAAMAVAQAVSIRRESQTWDEGTHLAAGLSYWKTGDYRMNPEHPPLVKLLCAVPLLFMDVRLPFEYPSWRERNELDFGAQFLYTNRMPAEAILFPARLVTIALTLLLGAAMAFWTRRHFGAGAALLALAFFAFDPNLIAHGRYVTTDLAVTLFSFLACILWGEALLRRASLSAALAGIALGCALTSKFSAVFLIPALLALAAFRWPGWKPVAILFAAAWIVLWIPYLPELRAQASILPPSWLLGFEHLLQQSRDGHLAYLLGQISTTGWWYYFPVAFLVKAPAALLALIAAAIFVAIRKRDRPGFPILVLLVPCLIYWGLCLTSRIDLGIRHLLPAYALMIPLAAAAVARRLPRPLLLGLCALLALESASIFPDYLAFFNRAAGGPGYGPHYLLDSNIDWGQDTLKLKAWLDARGIHSVCNAYFGIAVFSHYGIGETHLPRNEETQARRDVDCVAAISVTPLYGLYVPNDAYRWLRELQPVAKIGYSIYVYDLRKVNRRSRDAWRPTIVPPFIDGQPERIPLAASRLWCRHICSPYPMFPEASLTSKLD